MRLFLCFLFSTILMGQINLFAPAPARSPMAKNLDDQEAKKFNTSKDKVVLYAFRTYGNNTKYFNLFVDNIEIAKTTERSFIRLELSPGLHEILAKRDNDSTLRIYMEAGKSYFVQLDWYRPSGGLGWPLRIFHDPHKVRLELLPEEDEREAILKCRLLANTSPVIE
ncbi:DUF2846 domain-containing protein [Geothrix alkalitolerans]|uniref:DUF2846 domain-containing protein n=1 Tax=Geothrix alkalitolerans TaxID=2922724 RepID=UPI001FAE8649|nr:DUF2846 domain-containing protein [Geothrix alkalitolerans]